MNNTAKQSRIGVLLAGGQSSRMGGPDKAELMINGQRLIDIVIGRFAGQVDRLVISGATNYATDLANIPDRADGPKGPAAGLYALARWLQENEKGAGGFFTAPVDGPFLPPDLVEKFASTGGAAVASDGRHLHPTFAYWEVASLLAALERHDATRSLSLKALAKKCGAAPVIWSAPDVFFNVNTPADYERVVTSDAGGA